MIVLGAEGMLGSAFCELLKDSLGHHFLSKGQVDITSPQSINNINDFQGQRYIINCGAYTDVDGCEVNPKHAIKVNKYGPLHLAQYCYKRDITLVHFSTDYVFPGNHNAPQDEDDETYPLNVYGKSKLAGELEIKAIHEKHYIFRLQWLFGKNGKNFIDTIRNINCPAVVTDQKGSPSWTNDIARCVLEFLQNKPPYGTYHLTSQGNCSLFEFARYFKENTIRAKEYPRQAIRPKYNVLDTNKVRLYCMPMHWKRAVDEYLKKAI